MTPLKTVRCITNLAAGIFKHLFEAAVLSSYLKQLFEARVFKHLFLGAGSCAFRHCAAARFRAHCVGPAVLNQVVYQKLGVA